MMQRTSEIRQMFSEFLQTKYAHGEVLEVMVDLIEADASFVMWTEMVDNARGHMDNIRIMSNYEAITGDVKSAIIELYNNQDTGMFTGDMEKIVKRLVLFRSQ